MRISDWSSDVCSSDLPSLSQASVHDERSWREGLPVRLFDRTVSRALAASILSFTTGLVSASAVVSHTDPHQAPCAPIAIAAAICRRSEEHTSELQSLMRISYAVFCLKKKNITHPKHTLNT